MRIIVPPLQTPHPYTIHNPSCKRARVEGRLLSDLCSQTVTGDACLLLPSTLLSQRRLRRHELQSVSSNWIFRLLNVKPIAKRPRSRNDSEATSTALERARRSNRAFGRWHLGVQAARCCSMLLCFPAWRRTVPMTTWSDSSHISSAIRDRNRFTRPSFQCPQPPHWPGTRIRSDPIGLQKWSPVLCGAGRSIAGFPS